MEKDKILITGGSGFIGTNLAHYFLDRNVAFLTVDIQRPLNPAHDPFWVQGDILDAGSMRKLFSDFQPTHVVHLAARTDLDEKQSLDGYRVNIEGTENILRCISKTPYVLIRSGNVRREHFRDNHMQLCVCRSRAVQLI